MALATMDAADESRRVEEYLRHQSAEMFNLLRHYETLSFMVFQFYLTGVVAIVTIMITISQQLGTAASLFQVPAMTLLTAALLVVGTFVYSRQLWLQVRMTRALRQINAIRGYFARAYENVAATVLYPANPVKPSFLEPRDPLQLVVVVLVNGVAAALLLPMTRPVWVVLLAAAAALAQLCLYLAILLRAERMAQRSFSARRDFISGAPIDRPDRDPRT